MKRKLLTALVVAMLSTSLGMSSGWAQGDLAKTLVGKWEGTVQWAGGAGSGAGDPNRTLVIDSVEQKDGKWVAVGKYGVTGKVLEKLAAAVDDSGGRPSISFVTGANSTVRLSLVGDKQLSGTLSLSGHGGRRESERRMTLERTN